MGEARRRGSFEERKDKAIEEGHSKEMVRRRRANAKQRVRIDLYKAQLMAMMLAGKGRY